MFLMSFLPRELNCSWIAISMEATQPSIATVMDRPLRGQRWSHMALKNTIGVEKIHDRSTLWHPWQCVVCFEQSGVMYTDTSIQVAEYPH